MIQYQKKQKKPNVKIYLSSLPGFLTKKNLKEYFSNFGHIKSIEMMYDKSENGTNILINALMTCKNIETKNKILSVNHQLKGTLLNTIEYLEENDLKDYIQRSRSHRVYIKKLPDIINDDQLLDIFSKYGEVEKAYAVYGKRKRRGFKYGYVMYKNSDFLENLPIEGVKYKHHIIHWKSYELKKVTKEKYSEIREEEKLKEFESPLELNKGCEENFLKKRYEGVVLNLPEKIRKKDQRAKKKKTVFGQAKESLEEYEVVYVPKKKLDQVLNGSEGKKGVSVPRRRYKLISNFKKAHFFKPGDKSYHCEKRIDGSEECSNYSFKKEDIFGQAIRNRQEKVFWW